MKVLHVGVPDVGFKYFTPQGETGSCGFPLNCVFPLGVGFIERLFLSLSYPFVCGFFLFTCCVEVTQLVSGFISEAIVFYVIGGFMCLLEVVHSEATCVAILNLKIARTYFLVDFLDVRK